MTLVRTEEHARTAWTRSRANVIALLLETLVKVYNVKSSVTTLQWLRWGCAICFVSVNLGSCIPDSEECLNGGTCFLNAQGQYECACPSGFDGDTCNGTTRSLLASFGWKYWIFQQFHKILCVYWMYPFRFASQRTSTTVLLSHVRTGAPVWTASTHSPATARRASEENTAPLQVHIG